MQHPFHDKSPKKQLQIQVAILFFAFLLNFIFLVVSLQTQLYFIIFLSIVITLSIVAPFIDVPSMKKTGKLNYFSLLFLAEKEKNGVIVIHGGTLLDYVFVLDRQQNGNQRTRFILLQYLKGLLALLYNYEGYQKPLLLRGTSYILSPRTAAKLGFHEKQTDLLQKIILIYNYVNITITLSLAKAKLRLPNIKNIKTYEASLTDLRANADLIEQMVQRLEKRNYQ